MSNETKKRVSDIAEAIEPYDKVWGVGASGFVVDPSPFERINLILDDTEKTTNGEVFAERAVILTEALQAHKSEPYIIAMAHGMADWFRKCPIIIYPNELIVGTLGCTKKNAPIFPEFGVDWLVDEMENGLLGYHPTEHQNDYFSHSEECYQQLKSIQEYWKGNDVLAKADAVVERRRNCRQPVRQRRFLRRRLHHLRRRSPGHQHGTPVQNGLRRHSSGNPGQNGLSERNRSRGSKAYVALKAALICNEAATDMILRYADKAQELAQAEADETRKQELLAIEANCRQVASGTPETFWQALQALHFAHTLVQMESNGHSISYGRFDQFMYPYFKADIESGYMTREQMQELIENFNIKIWDMNKVREHHTVRIFANGGIGGPALTVGGLKADGTDGTNELSFMFLDAVAHTRIPTPWTAVRLHANTPRELLVKTANLIRLGLGEPKIFNDDVTIPTMIANGRSVEDARNYQVVGCVEPDATGKEYGWHDAAYFNMNRVLELAINNGYTNDGIKAGIDTGSLADFTSFDQVLEAYDKQMEYFCNLMVSYLNKLDLVHQEMKPLPYLTNMIEGCVATGKDVTAGGAIYNYSGPQGVGVGSVGDGLATIKQLVFDEKKVTGRELLDAVRDNWVGHEKLYALVNSDYVHHYGNDDDYADQLAKFGLETYCKHINGKPTAHGGHFQAGCLLRRRQRCSGHEPGRFRGRS